LTYLQDSGATSGLQASKGVLPYEKWSRTKPSTTMKELPVVRKCWHTIYPYQPSMQ